MGGDLILPALVQALDEKLRTVLAHVTSKSILLDPCPRLTLELFLCGLYAQYQEEILQFFQDPSKFRKMVDEICPKGVSDPTPLEPRDFWTLLAGKAEAAGFEIEAVGLGEAPGFDLSMEQELMDILWSALKLSAAAGRSKVGIADFFSALALKDEVVQRLSKQRGITLRGF